MAPRDTSEPWDLVIDSDSGSRIGLRQALKYRDLIVLFVRRDLVVQYKQTVLGPLWIFVQPLLRVATFYIVFGRIAKVPTDGVPPVLFYLTGLVFWEYFASIWKRSSDTFYANQHIFGKVFFPRMVMPMAAALSAGVRLAVQLLLLAVIALYWQVSGFDIQINATLALLPLYLLALTLLGLGLGLVFASLTAKYRDLRFLIDVVIQLALFLSPIIYPLGLAEGTFRRMLLLNPMTSLLEALRYGILGRGEWLPEGLLYSAVAAVGVFLLGFALFSRTERKFIDTI